MKKLSSSPGSTAEELTRDTMVKEPKVIKKMLENLHEHLKVTIYTVTLLTGLIFTLYLYSQIEISSQIVNTAIVLVILYWFLLGCYKIIRMQWKRDTKK